MRLPSRALLCSAVALLLGGTEVGFAQSNPHPNVIVNQQPSETAVLPCHPGVDFEAEHYTIAHVKLDDPFKFLYWVSGKTKNLEAQLDGMLKNHPFTYTLAGKDALKSIEDARFVPVSDVGFVVRVELVSVQNCNPDTKTLELIYRIYSTEPPHILGGATEAQQTVQKSPQTTTGLTQTGNAFHLTATAGYNRSYSTFGGGQLQITPRYSGFHPFNSLIVNGQGSTSMRAFSVALVGSADFHRWLRHADWRFNYENDSLPAGVTRLENAGLSAQLSGESRPFWNQLFLLRFGGLVQGGNMQSPSTALLPPQTVASSGYGSFKSYLGLSSRSKHNVLSASYGLELGSVKPTAGLDWLKHVGDVVDEFWVPIGDHKPLEVESRFTIGAIQVLNSIPQAALFFGGNDDRTFVPGDSWQIRAVPTIRAIPANLFNQTARGVGADSFKSLNLTVSYPVWSRAVMPRDLSTDPEFKSLLDAQIVSATNVEQNYYAWTDPHFSSALDKVPELKQRLDALQNAVNAAQSAHPDQAQDAFDDCNANIGGAVFDVDNLLKNEKKVSQYGELMDLLPAGQDNWLGSIHDSCGGALMQQVDDPGIKAAVAAVDASQAAILTDFNGIDQASASEKAKADMAFVNRTLKTLFNDLNILSVSPAVVFDVASIGPSNNTFGGTRIGPGGGVRLELASSVNFTLGYAWNIHQHPGEGKGALFFSINTRDIFH
jgi:hypothetical protein